MIHRIKNKYLVFVIFSLIVCQNIFAGQREFLKSRYCVDDKMIDCLYIDAVEGLRIRDKPTLQANKIGLIDHQLKVKPVSIGPRAVIDGIDDYWVEILVPRYLWKSDNPEYGWVFGGYLKETRPDFVCEGWTKKDLENYLTTYLSWSFYDKYSEYIGFMHFYSDGTFTEIHPRPGDPGYRDDSWSDEKQWKGTWKAIDGRTFEVSAKESRTGDTYTKRVYLDNIYREAWISGDGGNSNATLYDSGNVEGWINYEIKTIRDGSILRSKGIYLYDCWNSEVTLWHKYYNDEDYKPSDKLIMDFVKAGINVSYDEYDEYWTKIIEERLSK